MLAKPEWYRMGGCVSDRQWRALASRRWFPFSVRGGLDKSPHPGPTARLHRAGLA
jgi:hypothetical protein